MIPKKLHYCWFGNKKMPQRLLRCIKTWQLTMPDYEIKRWDESNTNMNSNVFVEESYNVKKWAFVTDYIRLFALYNEGGIYLDTDVIVTKRFDDFLQDDFFSAVEYHPALIEKKKTFQLINKDGTLKDKSTGCPGIGILAAVMGSVPKHEFIKECMDYYNNRHFVLADGSFDIKVNPAIYAEVAEKYGFRYFNILQKIGGGGGIPNMVFYPSSVLSGDINTFTPESYALHYAENLWLDKNMYQLIKSILSKNNLLRRLFHKEPNEVNKLIRNIVNNPHQRWGLERRASTRGPLVVRGLR
jgi:mannosyltransferase OCH1-like enzyme